MIKHLTLILAHTFIFSSCIAQYNKQTINQKAQRLFKEAQVALQMGDIESAKNFLFGAVKLDENYCDAHILLGDINKKNEDFDMAIENYKSALQIDANYANKCNKYLGEIYLNKQFYKESETFFATYLSNPKTSASEKIETTSTLNSLKFIADAVTHPVPYNPIKLSTAVNSEYPDYYPYLTLDGEKLIFVRLINKNEDFYVSVKKNGEWQPAFSLSEPINSAYNEGGITFSVDKNQLFFVRCGDKINGDGSCDIYGSYKEGNRWSHPSNMGFNTAGFESQPSFSSDGKTLYFVSARKSSIGGFDIFSTEKTPQGWSEPKNLGPQINTTGTEQFPFIHPDNQTLYFVSNGKPGMGKADIFYSRKQPDGSWGEAINMGYPINSVGDERGIFITADGKKGIISQDKSGKGNYDLYEFDLYEAAQPIRVTYLKGIITDAKTDKPIAAQFQLIDLKTGKVITESESDGTTGNYLVSIPSGKDYALNVSNDKYLFYSENFSLQSIADSAYFIKNVQLQGIEVGKAVVMKNIFFETNKFDLKSESKVELKKLYDFLQYNSTIKILIGGHTDNAGTPQHNLELSENRAKSVYDYLVQKGIQTTRLQYKGFGETKPIVKNDSPEHKAQNRRTEFVVISK